MTKSQQLERETAIQDLKAWIKPGDTIYTVLRSVSRSGMQREIGVVLIDTKDGSMLHPNYKTSKACGYRLGKHDGVIANGCGMDMGFEIVYNLGRAMFPNGVPCAGKGNCRSNDHVNSSPSRNLYSPSIIHEDGGYAFAHRWI